MYDIEMMEMLCLVHAENQCIFEILKTGLLSKEAQEKITFNAYEKEYKRIMKSIEKNSPCLNCGYKSRFEKITNITKEK